MRDQKRWTRNVFIWGLVLAGLGVVMAVLGVALPTLVSGIVLPEGLVPGVSLMLLFLGMVSYVQHSFVRDNLKRGQQMMIAERDERQEWILALAGQRTYWISSSLAFLLLVWGAFTEDVGLPSLSGNML